MCGKRSQDERGFSLSYQFDEHISIYVEQVVSASKMKPNINSNNRNVFTADRAIEILSNLLRSLYLQEQQQQPTLEQEQRTKSTMSS